MSIEKMKKLRVLAVRAQRDELMRELQRLGCLEVHEPAGLLADEDAAALLRPEGARLAQLRAEQSELLASIRVLERYAPQKKKLLSARPRVGEAEFLDAEALAEDMALARQLGDWDARLRRIAADEARLQTEIEALLPWEPLEEPLNSPGTKTCAVALFSAVSQIEPGSVRAAAESATEAVELLLVSDDEQQRCFAVIALREELPAVADALRGIGCTQVTFPGYQGTAKECAAARRAELDALAAEKTKLEGWISDEGPRLPALRLSADRLAAETAKAEATERLRGTDSIVALEGWCPARELPALEALLGRFDCAYETEDPAPEEYPEVPVKLRNKRFVKPMTLVTEMYSLPAYDGIDPNPYMWPFFVLFYGIMMADMGYGLLMLLAAWIALKKMRPKDGGTKYLLSLLGMCGVSTFIFGALTGGFFGDFLPQLVRMIDPDTTFTALPSLFTPLGDVMMIMIGSLALGVVQIFTGMIISTADKIKNGQALDALFSEGAWWCILFGIVLMVLHLGPWLLIVGGALLVIGQFWEKKSVVGGLVGLFGAIYNGVTGYFSDILSYLRLMALMLAGNVIAMVFNQLGAMTGSVIVFFIVAMVGNALNFALNLLGCFVHDLRLQVLEFFGRFYKDGGKAYKPLHIDPDNVELIKEDI